MKSCQRMFKDAESHKYSICLVGNEKSVLVLKNKTTIFQVCLSQVPIRYKHGNSFC